MSRKCAYPPCSVELDGSRPNKKYCCGSHRSMHSVLRNHGNLGAMDDEIEKDLPEKKSASVSSKKSVFETDSMSELPVHARFMIRQLEKEVDRWEKLYNEQKVTAQKFLEKKDAIQKELDELKNEEKIRTLSKPSGLDGIMQSPLIEQLMPHIGPSLGKYLDRMIEAQGTPKAIAGIENLDEQTRSMMENMMKWFATLDVPTQKNIYMLLNNLSMDQEKINARINQFTQSMNYGNGAATAN